MSKAILISIKPRFVADILNGKKVLEIRKTFPKCKCPIDVYIYCTKSNYLGFISKSQIGKVVAKFTLNKVKAVSIWDEYLDSETLGPACLDAYEFDAYTKGQVGYAWHIDDLVIFDQPMELHKFYKYGVDEWAKKHAGTEIGYLEFWNGIDDFRLTKAPQSFMYVEILGEDSHGTSTK